MLTILEVQILMDVSIFSDCEHKINKSAIARKHSVSRTTVVNIINKFKNGEINVKENRLLGNS